MATLLDDTRDLGAVPHLTGTERLLVAMEVVLGLGAFGGAIGLVGGGTDLGGAVDDLPWQSPVLGGLALALVIGVFPLVVAAAAARRASWARRGHLAVGIALIAWIVVQVGFIGLNSWLQPAFALYGLVLVLLAVRLLRPGASTPPGG